MDLCGGPVQGERKKMTHDAKAVFNTLNIPRTCDEIAAILNSEEVTNRGLDILFDLKLIKAFWQNEDGIYIRKFKKEKEKHEDNNIL